MKTFILALLITFSVSAEYKIVGYLPEYRNLDVKKTEMLTDLILFSLKPEKDGAIVESPALAKLLTKAQKVNNCKKFICIGGWGKSENFKHFTADNVTRKSFIDKVETFVKKYNLDGVDYDWEHPKNKDEEKAYEALIKETAARGIKVSIAVAAWQKFTQEVFKHIHRVNLMSYDNPGKHSTLEDSKKDIEALVKLGCPPEKINLGVPFYGRHIENRKAASYRNIELPDNKTDEVAGYYFNSEETMKKKAKLVKDKKLSGMMIWEIEQDSNEYSLLKAIFNGLK